MGYHTHTACHTGALPFLRKARKRGGQRAPEWSCVTARRCFTCRVHAETHTQLRKQRCAGKAKKKRTRQGKTPLGVQIVLQCCVIVLRVFVEGCRERAARGPKLACVRVNGTRGRGTEERSRMGWTLECAVVKAACFSFFLHHHCYRVAKDDKAWATTALHTAALHVWPPHCWLRVTRTPAQQ